MSLNHTPKDRTSTTILLCFGFSLQFYLYAFEAIAQSTKHLFKTFLVSSQLNKICALYVLHTLCEFVVSFSLNYGDDISSSRLQLHLVSTDFAVAPNSIPAKLSLDPTHYVGFGSLYAVFLGPAVIRFAVDRVGDFDEVVSHVN